MYLLKLVFKLISELFLNINRFSNNNCSPLNDNALERFINKEKLSIVTTK